MGIVSAMEMEREPKEGRGGPPDVVCGAWTNRVVNIGKNSAATFEADKSTKRCTVLYKRTARRWSSPAPTCWWTTGTQNNAREEMLSTKAENTKPETFCRRDSLVPEFPARSRGNMKVWYVNTEGILGKGRYKNQGVKCTATCHK